MNLKTTTYAKQSTTLPAAGRHIMAHYDDDVVLVYIPHIGEYYGDKTVSRPIWITTSFTWMMHHADWLDSPEYESIECMTIQRMTFDEILLQAYPVDFADSTDEAEDDWQLGKANAIVQYRWQKDYAPDGHSVDREVLLLGVHSRTWMQYVMKSLIVNVNDIDEALYRQKDRSLPPFDQLMMPEEKLYPVDESIKSSLNME